MKIIITDESHPHYGELGELTGKVVSLFGTAMAEVKLENCQHGTDGCFIKAGQATQMPSTTRKPQHPKPQKEKR